MFEFIWEYMNERQSIYLKKEAGQLAPWTQDPVLQEFKFTNVFRRNDRTSRVLADHYNKSSASQYEPRIVLLNTTIARYFGLADFTLELGWQEDFSKQRIVDVARSRKARGLSNFTGAYMVTNGQRKGPKEEVISDFIEGVWTNGREITSAAHGDNSWKTLVTGLRTLPGFNGTGFMAKEVALDYMVATDWQPEDYAAWTPYGPGGLRGANRILQDKGIVSKKRALHTFIGEVRFQAFMGELKEEILKHWKYEEELTYHDIQFNLCEWDKYCRVRDKEGRPRAKYYGGKSW